MPSVLKTLGIFLSLISAIDRNGFAHEAGQVRINGVEVFLSLSRHKQNLRHK